MPPGGLQIDDLGGGPGGWDQPSLHVVAVSVRGGVGYFEAWWETYEDHDCHQAYNSGPQYCQFIAFNDGSGALHYPTFFMGSLYTAP